MGRGKDEVFMVPIVAGDRVTCQGLCQAPSSEYVPIRIVRTYWTCLCERRFRGSW